MRDSIQFQFLQNQVDYKLANYEKSIASYEHVLKKNAEEENEEAMLPPEDMIDVITNYMACQASLPTVNWEHMEKFLG